MIQRPYTLSAWKAQESISGNHTSYLHADTICCHQLRLHLQIAHPHSTPRLPLKLHPHQKTTIVTQFQLTTLHILLSTYTLHPAKITPYNILCTSIPRHAPPSANSFHLTYLLAVFDYTCRRCQFRLALRMNDQSQSGTINLSSAKKHSQILQAHQRLHSNSLYPDHTNNEYHISKIIFQSNQFFRMTNHAPAGKYQTCWNL